MFDLDDFKRVNDVYGHGAGDQVLIQIARLAPEAVRGSDIVCRIGGEEFGVIMPSCDAADAVGLAARLTEGLRGVEIEPAGRMTVSLGVAQGPQHAMNPRELVACAEAAMMTAKARGKNQVVVFYEDEGGERPSSSTTTRGRDVRSIAHLKMLQSLAGKLNRLNDVRQIGETIATELRQLIDYHNCRVVAARRRRSEADRARRRLRPERRLGRRGVCHQGRARHHRPRRRDRRVDARAKRARVRVRESRPRHRRHRGVARRGSAPLRLARDRRDRHLQARHEPVRRRRRPAARGARGPGVRGARERAALRAQRSEAERAKALLGPAEVSRARVGRRDLQRGGRDRPVLFETEHATLWLGDRARRVGGEPIDDGVTAGSRRGSDVHGRLVIGRRELDDERKPTLAAFAYQVSAALQKALLYARQREAAEIASALLEAGRELATAESPDEVLRRSVEVTARVLRTPRAALWIQEEHGPMDLVARAAVGHEPGEDPVDRVRFPPRRPRSGSHPTGRSCSSRGRCGSTTAGVGSHASSSPR